MKRFLKIQNAQLLQNQTREISVKYLQKAVQKSNNGNSDVGNDTCNSGKTRHCRVKSHTPPVPLDGVHQYLYRHGELEDDNRRRATGMIWSWDTFRLDKIVALVKEEVWIPEDTEIPPKYVKDW